LKNSVERALISENPVFFVYALLAAAFLADVNLPPEVAGGICYVLPLLVCLRYCEIKHFAWVVVLSITGIGIDLVDTSIMHGWRVAPPLNAAAALVAMLISSWFVRQLDDTRQSESRDYQAMEAILHGVINNAPVLIAVKDLEGRYTMINQWLRDQWGPAADRMLGHTGPEISLDKSFGNMMHAQDLRLMRDEETNTALEQFPMQPNKTYYTTRFPLYDNENKVVGLGGVSLDITEFMDARGTIERQNLDLEASNKELQRFAQVAAHDLQEPLRMMTTFSELLIANLGNSADEESQQYLEFIARNARRSQQQIRDLLVYSSLSACEEPAFVDLNAVLQAAIRNVVTDADMHYIKCEALPHVYGNAKQLQQLFEQLIDNALKFNDSEDVKISISADEIESDKVSILVRDNGVGVDKQHASHIFEIFTRLHDREAKDSTGIGLAICRRIMQLHHGHVHVLPNEDQGSTFVCTFPKEL
jgi:signal transduction histidine kinase